MSYDTDVLRVKGYGKTPLFINKKPVYVGLEIEALAIDDSGEIENINKFSTQSTYLVPTKDGSLDDDFGIEFIFRPEGLEEQKANVADFVDSVDCSLDHDFNDNYGIHVHVSNHFLGKATKLKIQNFVSLNCKHYVTIGGRESTGYQKVKDDHFNQLNRDRYQMVNILPAHTIEFRFPASIIEEDHINLNLENALATVMFCKFHLNLLDLRKDHETAFLQYCKFVKSNSAQYPLLAEKLDEISLTITNENIENQLTAA